MAELVAHAGFEWGTIAGLTTGNSGNRVFDSSAGAFSVDAAAARTGHFGLRVNLANSWVAWTTATIGAGRTMVVGSLYVRFPAFLPGVDTVFLSLDTAAGSNVAFLKFSAFNARVYAGAGGVEVPSSVTFVADTWYRLDFRWDVSANPHLFEWQIDGVAQTQATGSLAPTTFSRIRFGCPTAGSPSSFVDFDDVLVSATAGDYPLGEHKVELLSVDNASVREFNGSTDLIDLDLGLVPPLGGPLTVLFLVKLNSNEEQFLLLVEDTAFPGEAWWVNTGGDGQLYFSTGAFTSTPFDSADGWAIVGFTKAAGTSQVRAHKYVLATGTWTHSALGSIGDSFGLTPDRLRIGNQSAGSSALNGQLALAGVWNSVLSDTAIEDLAGTLAAWQAADPAALWVFTQASTADQVIDLTGNGADQTAIVGTTAVRGDAPPGFDLGADAVTVSGSTANFNTFSANGTLAPWDPDVARDAIDDQTPTVGAAADGIVQVATAADAYVQVPMSSYALQSGEAVMGVRMLACGWAASAAAATIGFRSWNGSTESVLAAAADPNFDNSSSPAWLCRQVPAADIHTQVELDALAFRVGFSDNAAVPVGIHALFAEVAVAQGIVGTPGFGNPAPVPAAASVPTPTPARGATNSPALVAAAAVVPQPLLVVNASVTPAAVAAAAALPTVVVSGASARTPAAVPAVSVVPAPDVFAHASAGPAPVAAVLDAPLPAPTTSGFGTAAPGAVAAAASVATPTLSSGSAGLPAAVVAAASVRGSSRSAGATASPAAVLARAVGLIAQAISKATEHRAAPHRIFASIARGTIRRTG